MRNVKEAMLSYDASPSASRLCTTPSYPHSGGVTPHNAINKIACYVFSDTFTYPMLIVPDSGGSAIASILGLIPGISATAWLLLEWIHSHEIHLLESERRPDFLQISLDFGQSRYSLYFAQA